MSAPPAIQRLGTCYMLEVVKSKIKDEIGIFSPKGYWKRQDLYANKHDTKETVIDTIRKMWF